MSRFDEIKNFLNFELKRNNIIEAEKRKEILKERVLKSIKTYHPALIIKVGAGRGDLLMDIAGNCEYLVVVEPCIDAIYSILENYKDNQLLKKIHFICGGFTNFPIDYYRADMLICIDYLDFIESGSAVDEFKRALQFEGIFFFGGIVLHDNDEEGVYDEFIHLLNPLHNDYYLPEDLKTFFTLKEFTSLQGGIDLFNRDLQETIEYWSDYCKTIGACEDNKKAADEFIEENKSIFSELYGLNDDFIIKENYLTALFRKNKMVDVPPSID